MGVNSEEFIMRTIVQNVVGAVGGGGLNVNLVRQQLHRFAQTGFGFIADASIERRLLAEGVITPSKKIGQEILYAANGASARAALATA